MAGNGTLRGALWMGGAVLSFSAMAIAVRELLRHMGPFEVLFVRSIVMLSRSIRARTRSVWVFGVAALADVSPVSRSFVGALGRVLALATMVDIIDVRNAGQGASVSAEILAAVSVLLHHL